MKRVERVECDGKRPISGSSWFKTKHDNCRTYAERDLQAVNITAVVIPTIILAPSLRKVPLQILRLGFVFRNDENVPYLHERGSLLSRRLALLMRTVLSKLILQDRNNFADLLITFCRASMLSRRCYLEYPQSTRHIRTVKVNGKSIEQGEVRVVRNIVRFVLQIGEIGDGPEPNNSALPFGQSLIGGIL